MLLLAAVLVCSFIFELFSKSNLTFETRALTCDAIDKMITFLTNEGQPDLSYPYYHFTSYISSSSSSSSSSQYLICSAPFRIKSTLHYNVCCWLAQKLYAKSNVKIVCFKLALKGI